VALRDARPTVFRIRTLSDAIDSTNGPQGAMLALVNLVPAPYNREVFVPRPAAQSLTTFGSFTSPTAVELEYVVGQRVYGFVKSGRFAGKSEPFIYNYVTKSFVTISGVTSANCPTSTPSTGDWTPPTAALVGGWVIFTHPGFPGSGTNFGWLDISGFTNTPLTGTTNGTTTISALSYNPILAGITPGMTITDSLGDIPANATIVSLTGTGAGPGTGTITLSQAATGGHPANALTIAGGTFGAPLWAAGNVNQNPLPSVPTAVANFDGSAWYAVGAATQFSDVGNPLQQSNNPVPQVINYQNGLTITALAPSPFLNAVGSIAQSLLVFQGTGAIQQVTGSAQTSNLASQLLASGVGTLAPNSISYVPNVGTSFVAPDGLRFVALQGIVTPALGTQGDGVSMPFINAVTPSRMCSAWNSDTLRIAVINETPPSGYTVTQEFWYHTKLQVWSGPHSFQTSLIAADQTDGAFIVSSMALGASLWTSPAVPSSNESYVENGATLTCGAMTSLLPDNQAMAMNALTETAIAFGSVNGMVANVAVFREDGGTLSSIDIPITAGSSTTWGSFIWGQARWGLNQAFYAQYQIPWSQPLLFKQAMVNITFPAGIGNAVGNLYLRIKRLGYLLLGENDAA
jgi:hypothetical protein